MTKVPWGHSFVSLSYLETRNIPQNPGFLIVLFYSFLCIFIITIVVINIIVIIIILVYILRFKFLLYPNPKLSIRLKTRIIITMNSQNTLLILINKLTVSLISLSFSSLFHQQHYYLYQYFKQNEYTKNKTSRVVGVSDSTRNLAWSALKPARTAKCTFTINKTPISTKNLPQVPMRSYPWS